MDKSNKQQAPKGPFSFLIFTSKPYWFVAIFAVTAVMLASTISSLVPYVFKRIIDSINGVTGLGPESIWLWVSLYIASIFAEGIIWRMSGFTGMHWATGVRATAREFLTAHVTRHSHSYFSNRFAGSIGSKLNNASEGVRRMAESIMWSWTELFIQLVISFILVFHTNTSIGIIFICWLVVVTPINILLVRKKVPLGIAQQARETELRGQTVDVLTNINAMHDYARHMFELGRFKELIDIRRRASLKDWAFSEWILVLNGVLETIFVGGMIMITVYLWSIGVITAGDIILILALVVSLRGQLVFIGQRFNNFAETIGEVKEGLEEILVEHEIVDAPIATKLRVLDGEIVLKDISFQYHTQSIFDKLNLTIKPGERVGLVGRSGAGKSTLMKLLTRQYDLGGGEILIDGQNIALVTQESLRDSVAVVPQDPLLFHRSLKENIGYGRLDATEEDIRASAEKAQAHRFIDVLPKKYETLVGERGIKLSGGERQRVAIARAFLKDAKILLLDEATSSLDSENEVMIQKALGELMKGKTVIAIAHRLSTLRTMDRIVVIENGQIVEDGSHEDLLKLGGIYSELWSHQAGGFLVEK